MESSSDSGWGPPDLSGDEVYEFLDEPHQGPVVNARIPLPDVDDIRIFTIDQSTVADAELTCHFQRVSASNPSPHITETLCRALALIRELQSNEPQDWDDCPTYGVAALWVDGICIDQGDPIERSRQVMMMGQIFASAKKSLV
ncbi:hypothetical protein AC579_5466 [Pseudocercospora musae]|uniref:Heterokaryon incompatibility domain-containing protein n=1 Tax=Pseudocercospora musae TaxID=113226 RepID=A0A139IQD2_9PEZI|nr:hypothetical protein AC579_5466 [Pseudocercospora musae]